MKVRIGDICTLKSGTSLKDDVLNANEGIPYIKVSDMNLEGNEKYIIKANSYANESISPKMLFPIGTILFPKRGGAIGTNKKRIANKVVCADLNTMGVIPSEKVRPLFLYYYFQNIDFGTLYNGSSVPQINNTDIAPMEIELLSLQEQDEAIAVLEKVDNIISGRKRELERLDALIKARFVELFGDIISNERCWKVDTWSNVLKIVNGRNQKAVEAEDGKYLICGSGGAMGKATNYLTKENSVIVGRKGNINKPILMREKYWNVDTAFGIEPNEEYINVEYLYMFCIFFDFEKLNKAVTIPSLTKADLLNIEIPIPDMRVQEQFANFVHQVDKSKVKEIKKNYEPIDNGFYYKNIWKGL